MRKQIFATLTIIGMALALNSASAAQAPGNTSVNQLQSLEKQVNQLTRGTNQWLTAMHTISVQTGVPWAHLRALRQRHPNAEPAGILIAAVLADETKKTPEQFLKAHLDGQTWPAIAKNYNVPLDKLTERLQKIQQALEGGTGGKP